MHLLPSSSSLRPMLPKPQQLKVACCVLPAERFYGGGGEVLVSLVHIKHTVYINVIGQLLI